MIQKTPSRSNASMNASAGESKTCCYEINLLHWKWHGVECKCPTIKIRLWGTHDQKLDIWVSESPTPGINSGFTCKGNATFGRTDTARRTFLPLRALICLWIGAKIPAGLSIHIVIHEKSATKKSCGEKNIGNSWGGAKDIVFMNSTEVGKKLGITICLDCTCVSKYFGMCNALVKFTMQRGFWGSVTLTQIQANVFFQHSLFWPTFIRAKATK